MPTGPFGTNEDPNTIELVLKLAHHCRYPVSAAAFVEHGSRLPPVETSETRSRWSAARGGTLCPQGQHRTADVLTIGRDAAGLVEAGARDLAHMVGKLLALEQHAEAGGDGEGRLAIYDILDRRVEEAAEAG